MVKKWAKDLNIHFTKNDVYSWQIGIWKSSQHHYHWEVQIKIAKIQNHIILKYLEDVGKQNLSFIIHGNERCGMALLEDNVNVGHKVNHRLIIWPSNHTESLLSRQITQQKESLYIVGKGQEQ